MLPSDEIAPARDGVRRRDGLCRNCEAHKSHRRGLCNLCYTTHLRAGTLEDVASPLVEKRPVGHRRFEKDGYVNVMTGTGSIPEHRYVMQQMLGRELAGRESVHHRNGIRHDNRPENLELWYRQPAGQRISDVIDYLIQHHRDALVVALMDPRRGQSGGGE